MSFEKLEQGPSQWPVNDKAPEGTPVMHIGSFVRGVAADHGADDAEHRRVHDGDLVRRASRSGEAVEQLRQVVVS